MLTKRLGCLTAKLSTVNLPCRRQFFCQLSAALPVNLPPYSAISIFEIFKRLSLRCISILALSINKGNPAGSVHWLAFSTISCPSPSGLTLAVNLPSTVSITADSSAFASVSVAFKFKSGYLESGQTSRSSSTLICLTCTLVGSLGASLFEFNAAIKSSAAFLMIGLLILKSIVLVAENKELIVGVTTKFSTLSS